MKNTIPFLSARLFRRLPLWLLATGLAACPAWLHAQQVVDGGFELDTPSTTVSNPGTGWTENSPPNQAFIYSNSFGHGITAFGNQWLFIGTGSVSQTIPGNFVAGTPYKLFFQAADIEGGSVPYIYAFLSGSATANKMFSLSPSSSYYNNTALAFVNCEVDFVPTATGSLTITLGADTYPVAIDNVFVVPEPRTWIALILGGLGLLGVAVRRRTRRA